MKYVRKNGATKEKFSKNCATFLQKKIGTCTGDFLASMQRSPYGGTFCMSQIPPRPPPQAKAACTEGREFPEKKVNPFFSTKKFKIFSKKKFVVFSKNVRNVRIFFDFLLTVTSSV